MPQKYGPLSAFLLVWTFGTVHAGRQLTLPGSHAHVPPPRHEDEGIIHRGMRLQSISSLLQHDASYDDCYVDPVFAVIDGGDYAYAFGPAEVYSDYSSDGNFLTYNSDYSSPDSSFVMDASISSPGVRRHCRRDDSEEKLAGGVIAAIVLGAFLCCCLPCIVGGVIFCRLARASSNEKVQGAPAAAELADGAPYQYHYGHPGPPKVESDAPGPPIADTWDATNGGQLPAEPAVPPSTAPPAADAPPAVPVV